LLREIRSRFGNFAVSWPTASLGTYLVVVILLATLPIAALMSWQIFSSGTRERQQIELALSQMAMALSISMQREFDASADMLLSLSHSDAIQRDDIQAFRARLGPPLQMRRGWDSVYLRDAAGLVVLDTRADASTPARGVTRLGGMPLRPVLSDLGAGSMTSVEVPVLIDAQPQYVLGARVPSATWQGLIERFGVPPGGIAMLVDRNGRIVARSDAASAAKEAPGALDASAHQAIAARAAGFARLDHPDSTEPLYTAWHTVGDTGWQVLVSIPSDPLDAAQRRAAANAIATAAACLLGVALALFAARRIARPLRELAVHGPEQAGRSPVQEIEWLREALAGARAQDAFARRRLQAKADEFEALFHSSPIGMAVAQDPHCELVLHNAEMTRLLGKPVAPDSPEAPRVRFRGQPLPWSEQPLQRAATTGEAVRALELEVQTEVHSSVHVLATAVPLLDASGQPRGALAAFVDITERKLMESRLLRSDQRLRESQHLVDLAQEAGHVGFFQYRFASDALSWTPAQAKLFGINTQRLESTLDEWVQRVDPLDRVPVEQSLRRMIANRVEKETLEFRVMRGDGSSRWLSGRLLVQYGRDGRPQQLIGVTMDVTDQKDAERERAKLVEREQSARRDAEAANRAKDEFLAMLGHELRNPLSAISSAVEVLNRVDADADVAINARNIIARQTRHLAHMMDDLLDVGRVISGKVLLSRHSLNLAQLAQRVVGTLQVTGEGHQHELVLQTQDVWVDADSTRIEQVLSNLLSNALKYTPVNGRVEIDVRQVGSQALLEVRDTGVGIAPALLPRIFDLFVQGERTLDRRAGGLGIGLTLVRRLVEMHGGNVTATSSPSGSVFTVKMPAVQAPAVANIVVGVPESRRRRVTLVEDNEDALNSLRTMLELDGHTVWTATDGIQGLDSVLKVWPDVALVDLGLPGLTGYQVARRSRAAGFPGRMIALSGYGQARDIAQALAAGFDAHIVKPVDADELRRILRDD